MQKPPDIRYAQFVPKCTLFGHSVCFLDTSACGNRLNQALQVAIELA